MPGSGFLIRGGTPLFGEVRVPGAKNAALKMIAACLLTEERCVLENVPWITDVARMLGIVRSIGALVEEDQAERRVAITARTIDATLLPHDDIAALRASVVLLGPLLLRCGKVRMPYPGGDHIGARPLTAHFRALEQLGILVKADGTFINAEVPRKGLCAGNVVLPEFSVTATENVLLLAAGIPGETTIDIAALEPHVRDLAIMLSGMGAETALIGSHRYRVRGSPALKGVTHRIVGDILDAFTFLAAGFMSRGSTDVIGVSPEDMRLPLWKLHEMGIRLQEFPDGLKTENVPPTLQETSVQALPYPGVPSDLQPLFALLATQAGGTSLIHDPLYENRFRYAEELRRMGADITQLDAHRIVVRGPTSLNGVRIASFDIRAGAVLVVAGLAAGGETVIENIHHIDRGYENIEGRLESLGASIQRID